MAQTTLATLNTPNAAQQLSYQLLSVNDDIVLLGRWDFEVLAVGETTKLAELPQVSYPEDATPAERKDVVSANSLTIVHPSKLFDAFKAARAINLFLYRKQSDLVGKGYSGEALLSAVERPTLDATAELGKLTDDAYAAWVRATETRTAIASDFPETGESEFQETIFDAAIIARFEPLTPAERNQLKGGNLPQRLNDARMVQALYRTPACMHGLDAKATAALQRAYANNAWPCTTTMLNTLDSMVQREVAPLVRTPMRFS